MVEENKEERKVGSPSQPQKPSIKNMAQAVKDAVKLEIMRPVKTRVINRVKEIEELSQAKSISVDMGDKREWYTEPPSMFITGLSHYMQNGVGVITYYKYKTQKNKETGELEKASKSTWRESEVTGRKIEHDRQYLIDKLVKETIAFGKGIEIEEVDYDGQ